MGATNPLVMVAARDSASSKWARRSVWSPPSTLRMTMTESVSP